MGDTLTLILVIFTSMSFVVGLIQLIVELIKAIKKK